MTPSRRLYHLDHIQALESEAIYVLREAAAQFERVALLFSGGKDSLVLAHLARKAFSPMRPPMPLLHVDTGHNFPETLAFRDRIAEDWGFELRVASVQASIDEGRVEEETGPHATRNALQSVTLLDAIEAHGFDCALGGARRDEEKSRAKERFFSHRDAFGQWDPKNQRPELWMQLNGRARPGEHFRVFPLSNWTEHDIWAYAQREALPLPSLYFAHERPVVRRGGQWLAVTPHLTLLDGERPETRSVRFRTIGDATCTGAVESTAAGIEEVLAEVATARTTERASRVDDQRSETSMEDRKRDGYF